LFYTYFILIYYNIGDKWQPTTTTTIIIIIIIIINNNGPAIVILDKTTEEAYYIDAATPVATTFTAPSPRSSRNIHT
jgi:hypothetical protein